METAMTTANTQSAIALNLRQGFFGWLMERLYDSSIDRDMFRMAPTRKMR
jgi:hypothetical protein